MESINITFANTYDDTVKAWRTFSRSSKTGKLWHRFGPFIISIFILLIFLIQDGPFTGNEFSIGGKPYPVLSFLSYFCLPVIFSLAAGWAIYTSSRTTREKNMAKQLKSYPADYFGETSITLEQGGLKIHAPLYEVQYDWRLLDTVLVTPDYLFICSRKGSWRSIVVWIPINALGSQYANTLSSVEKWLVKAK